MKDDMGNFDHNAWFAKSEEFLAAAKAAKAATKAEADPPGRIIMDVSPDEVACCECQNEASEQQQKDGMCQHWSFFPQKQVTALSAGMFPSAFPFDVDEPVVPMVPIEPVVPIKPLVAGKKGEPNGGCTKKRIKRNVCKR